jgi:hypothetical protein
MNKHKVPVFFWTALSIALLVMALSVGYYFVSFLPSKEESKVQVETVQEDKEKSEVQIRQDCRDEARQKAQDKLRKLIEAGLLSQSQKLEVQKALDQDLARKEDIDYYFDLCLEINGLSKE